MAMEDMRVVFDAVAETGAAHGLGAFGSLALSSMRIEKAYRVSADMTQEITAYEAGLMRFVDPYKAAIMAAPRWQLVLLDVAVAENDPLGGEGVFAGTRRVGIVTTTGYGKTTGHSLASTYVDPRLDVPGTRLDVRGLGTPTSATVPDGAVWDPEGVRPRR